MKKLVPLIALAFLALLVYATKNMETGNGKIIDQKVGEEFFLAYGQTAKVDDLEITYVAVNNSEKDVENKMNGDVIRLAVGKESKEVVFNGFRTTSVSFRGFEIHYVAIKRTEQSPVRLRVENTSSP